MGYAEQLSNAHFASGDMLDLMMQMWKLTESRLLMTVLKTTAAAGIHSQMVAAEGSLAVEFATASAVAAASEAAAVAAASVVTQ